MQTLQVTHFLFSPRVALETIRNSYWANGEAWSGSHGFILVLWLVVLPWSCAPMLAQDSRRGSVPELGPRAMNDFLNCPDSVVRCESGYLFLEGQYLHPPYEILLKDSHLVINGNAVPLRLLNLSIFLEDEPREMDSVATTEPFVYHRTVCDRGDYLDQTGLGLVGHGQGSDHHNLQLVSFTRPANALENLFDSSSWEVPRLLDSSSANTVWRDSTNSREYQLLAAIQATLHMGGATILASQYVPLFVDTSYGGYELLSGLAQESGSRRNHAILEAPIEIHNVEERLAWAHFFRSPPNDQEMRDRAATDLAEMDAADSNGRKICAASIVANFLGYPLTLAAMVLVVIAFGHLLTNKPQLDPSLSPQEIKRIIIKSLLMIALLSLIDLVWTVMANSTGLMREMNPVGRSFLGSPMRLSIFKILVVSLSIGLLYKQHHRPIAQAATWWSCLTLTLLTARWLTFQSMFL